MRISAYSKYLFVYMGAVRYGLIMEAKKRLYRLKNHTKDFMFLITCGERCLIFLQMLCLWF